MWQMQFMKTDRQIIEANIECNKLLHQLSDQSQYQIIYEDMEIRKYRPGQLICRMSKRSQLNEYYKKLYENKIDSIQEELQNKRIQQNLKDTGGANVAEDAQPNMPMSMT